ncbi:hypothetical protein [Paratractidigestivibacter sp.]|uniref:hypothetical protein n=1 Tax=Paratractidigestivibacter sp. TaxID=2847316 RepID=UPI002ACB0DD7|nr:hypothetical protein [Paratractidigestivibacter sp.]
MAKMIDISGKRCNRLTAIKPVRKTESGNYIWLCRCDCGKECEVEGSCFRSGKQMSCGCYASERIRKANTKHNGFGTRLYEIWRQMHRRCYGEHTKFYKDYGGRGISVCGEWRDFSVFREWAYKNGYAENLTIDRIDVNGNYEPSNCRWATMKQQANNRRSNHIIKYMGQSHTISEWADIIGISQLVLWRELNSNGWDLSKLEEVEKWQKMNTPISSSRVDTAM